MDPLEIWLAFGVIVLVVGGVLLLLWCRTRPTDWKPEQLWHVYYRVVQTTSGPPQVEYRAGAEIGFVPPHPFGEWERITSRGFNSSLLAEQAAASVQPRHQEAVDNACRGKTHRNYMPTAWPVQ